MNFSNLPTCLNIKIWKGKCAQHGNNKSMCPIAFMEASGQ